jgi:hypothetical protein
MTSKPNELIRLSACVLLIGSLYTAQTDLRVTAAAAPVTVAYTQLFGDCFDDEVCGPEFSCDDPCWSYAPELPPFESICGDYSGEPWNGYGNCLGYCGDGYCNEFNDEEYGVNGCPADCGYCGDNKCQAPWETVTQYCAGDCGPVLPEPDGGPECDPERQEGCELNEYCNSQGSCLPKSTVCNSTGFCEDDDDCCENTENCYFQFATSQVGVCLLIFPDPDGPLMTLISD